MATPGTMSLANSIKMLLLIHLLTLSTPRIKTQARRSNAKRQEQCGYPTITYNPGLIQNTISSRSPLFPSFPEWFNDSLVPDIVDFYNNEQTGQGRTSSSKPVVNDADHELFSQIYVGHKWPEMPADDGFNFAQETSSSAAARFDPESERPGRLSYGYVDSSSHIDPADSIFDSISDYSADNLFGRTQGKITNSDIGRIVGGQEAVAHSWPWMAYLNFRKRYHCGGSLLSAQWTVTAAHCITRFFPVVVLGLHNLRSLQDTQIIMSDRIVKHPKYNRPKAYDNDVALVRHSKPAVLGEYVQPICLPNYSFDIRPGFLCVTTGWGRTDAKVRSYPDKLQEVAVKIIDMEECKRLPKYKSMVTDNMICAGHLKGGRDACAGDSGGPLVCRLQSKANDGSVNPWILTGIVSWGIGCAAKNMPGVYAKTQNMLNFIKQHTDIQDKWSPSDRHKFSNVGTNPWVSKFKESKQKQQQQSPVSPAAVAKETVATKEPPQEEPKEDYNCGSSEPIQTGRGSLTSPNYPRAYKPNMKCQWIIETRKSTSYLYFRFNHINVDNPRNCVARDHIQLLSIDGRVLVPSLCRAKRGFGITSRGGLIIRFFTDGRAQRRGWTGTWKEIEYTRSDTDPKDYDPNAPCDEGLECDDSVDDMSRADSPVFLSTCQVELPQEYRAGETSQSITSPNYPTRYESGSRCYYVIRPESNGHKIRLEFTDFKLENGTITLEAEKEQKRKNRKDGTNLAAVPDCVYDAVEIRYAEISKKYSLEKAVMRSKLLEERCGNAKIRIKDSHSDKRVSRILSKREKHGWIYETPKPGQTMVVVFRTDRKRKSRGFKAEFMSVL